MILNKILIARRAVQAATKRSLEDELNELEKAKSLVAKDLASLSKEDVEHFTSMYLVKIEKVKEQLRALEANNLSSIEDNNTPNYNVYPGGCFVDDEAKYKYCGVREANRRRWKLKKSPHTIIEWDHMKSHFEIYNKRGKHIEVKNCAGERISGNVGNRTIKDTSC